MFKNAPPKARPSRDERPCMGCGAPGTHYWRVKGKQDPVYIEDFCSPECAVVTYLRGTWRDGTPIGPTSLEA